MKRKTTRSENESQPAWTKARSRTASEMITVLAPTEEEPKAILQSFIWKTNPQPVPDSGSVA